VRIHVGGSFWLALLDCYKQQVRNGMVPHVLDYEQNFFRGWTMSGRFVAVLESL